MAIKDLEKFHNALVFIPAVLPHVGHLMDVCPGPGLDEISFDEDGRDQ